MKQKVLSALALMTLVVVALLLPAPASAATGPVAVVSQCRTGWYVNEDESALLPTQAEAGFVFDGASLVHHATDAVTLAEVPEVGFTATRVSGVKPLFKMETSNPYSTVNVVADGKAWSSRIPATDKGGQNQPVTLTELAALAPYKADTRVFSFGVGYGNDTGNAALVTSITFGTTYALGCKVVTPEEPGYTAPTCTATGKVKVKTTEGITYDNVLRKGQRTITAKANDGFALKTGAKAEWMFPVAKLTGAQCEPTDEPTTPGGGTPTDEPSEAPSATPTPTGSATGTPPASSSPSVGLVPAGNGGSTSGGLPVTGPKVLTWFGVGGLLVAVGGLLLIGLRRKRDNEQGDDTQVMPAI